MRRAGNQFTSHDSDVVNDNKLASLPVFFRNKSSSRVRRPIEKAAVRPVSPVMHVMVAETLKLLLPCSHEGPELFCETCHTCKMGKPSNQNLKLFKLLVIQFGSSYMCGRFHKMLETMSFHHVLV